MSDKLGSVRSYPVSLPAAYVFTVRSLLSRLFHANMHPLSLSFHIFFSVFLSPSVFVSSFQGFGLKKWIHPPFISPSCFFFHIPFYRFSLTLFLCCTSLHDDATTLPLYLLCPLLTLSFPSHFLSHSPSLPLIEVLERGNEKCMYSVAVQCGSRRENCCFMVLFMDL